MLINSECSLGLVKGSDQGQGQGPPKGGDGVMCDVAAYQRGKGRLLVPRTRQEKTTTKAAKGGAGFCGFGRWLSDVI
jgi:hypothetical protein